MIWVGAIGAPQGLAYHKVHDIPIYFVTDVLTTEYKSKINSYLWKMLPEGYNYPRNILLPSKIILGYLYKP